MGLPPGRSAKSSLHLRGGKKVAHFFFETSVC